MSDMTTLTAAMRGMVPGMPTVTSLSLGEFTQDDEKVVGKNWSIGFQGRGQYDGWFLVNIPSGELSCRCVTSGPFSEQAKNLMTAVLRRIFVRAKKTS